MSNKKARKSNMRIQLQLYDNFNWLLQILQQAISTARG